MLAVLVVSAVALRRVAKRDDRDGRLLSASLVCVAVVVCVYHPANEAILLALPIVTMGLRCLATRVGASPLEWLAFGATAMPAANYLIMGSVVARMRPGGLVWLTATSLSGVALLVAFGALCGLAYRGMDQYVASGRRVS